MPPIWRAPTPTCMWRSTAAPKVTKVAASPASGDVLSGAVTNSGTLLVSGGTLRIGGVVSGGATKITGAGIVEIAQSSNENVTFLSGATGKPCSINQTPMAAR